MVHPWVSPWAFKNPIMGPILSQGPFLGPRKAHGETRIWTRSISGSPVVPKPTYGPLLGTNSGLLLSQVHFWVSYKPQYGTEFVPGYAPFAAHGPPETPFWGFLCPTIQNMVHSRVSHKTHICPTRSGRTISGPEMGPPLSHLLHSGPFAGPQKALKRSHRFLSDATKVISIKQAAMQGSIPPEKPASYRRRAADFCATGAREPEDFPNLPANPSFGPFFLPFSSLEKPNGFDPCRESISERHCLTVRGTAAERRRDPAFPCWGLSRECLPETCYMGHFMYISVP